MIDNVRTPFSPTPNNNLSPESNQMLFYTNDIPPETNNNWGDILSPKPNDTMRLYFQNINGVQSATNWNKWRDIVSTMSEHQVDIMGLAETNINWNPTRKKQALRLVRTQFKHSILLNATSD